MQQNQIRYVYISIRDFMDKKAPKMINEYLKEKFGCKVYRIALNGGFTCPNRDGHIGTRGCIFCSAGGSGDFAEDPEMSITQQIKAGKRMEYLYILDHIDHLYKDELKRYVEEATEVEV